MFAPTDDKADSSTASVEEGASPPQDVKPKTLAEVVEKAAAAHVKSDPSPEVETPAVIEKEEPADEEESHDEPEAKPDDKALPFNNHPRWKEVLKQRNEANQEVKRTRPLVEMAETLQRYCQGNNISDEDLSAALELAALSKTNMKEFRSRIQGLVDGIDFASGSRLPKDLQDKVDEGALSADYAKELAQLREKDKLSEQNSVQSQQRARQNNVQAVRSALNTWEESQKKLDPDYMGRREELQDKIGSMCAANPPQTAAEAIQLAEAANKAIVARSVKRQPRAKVHKPLSSNGSSTNQGETLKLNNLKGDLKNLVFAVAERHRKT